MTYNALLEKAETKEKERMKEEARKLKKLENALRIVLSELDISEATTWEETRPKLEGKPEFEAIAHEYERIRIFKVILITMIELRFLRKNVQNRLR